MSTWVITITNHISISSHCVYTKQMEDVCNRQVNQTTPVVKNNAKTFLNEVQTCLDIITCGNK